MNGDFNIRRIDQVVPCQLLVHVLENALVRPRVIAWAHSGVMSGRFKRIVRIWPAHPSSPSTRPPTALECVLVVPIALSIMRILCTIHFAPIIVIVLPVVGLHSIPVVALSVRSPASLTEQWLFFRMKPISVVSRHTRPPGIFRSKSLSLRERVAREAPVEGGITRPGDSKTAPTWKNLSNTWYAEAVMTKEQLTERLQELWVN